MNKRKMYLIIWILSASNVAISTLYLMKSLFYAEMQSSFQLTNLQLGQMYSAYGIFAMLAYILGAFFVSRFPCYQLLSVANIINGGILLYLSTFPSYWIVLLLFGCTGFLVGAVFYTAYMSTFHSLGTPQEQGKIFGVVFIGNSVFGSLFAWIGYRFTALPLDPKSQLKLVFIFFAVLSFLLGTITWLVLRKTPSEEEPPAKLTIRNVTFILQNRKMWAVILLVFANYVLFSNMNYLIPYLADGFTLSKSFLDNLAIIRLHILVIIASPIAGALTDRAHSASKVIGGTFLCYIAVMILMLTILRSNTAGTIVCVILLCFFAHAGKSMSFVSLDEADLPPQMYGMAVSLVSFLAYSPDAFYYSASGWILDEFGLQGHIYNFIIVTVVAVLGLLACITLNRKQSHVQ